MSKDLVIFYSDVNFQQALYVSKQVLARMLMSELLADLFKGVVEIGGRLRVVLEELWGFVDHDGQQCDHRSIDRQVLLDVENPLHNGSVERNHLRIFKYYHRVENIKELNVQLTKIANFRVVLEIIIGLC